MDIFLFACYEWQYGEIYISQKGPMTFTQNFQYPAAINIYFPQWNTIISAFSAGIFLISVQLFIYFSVVSWMEVELGLELPFITLKFRFRKNINECKFKTYSD